MKQPKKPKPKRPVISPQAPQTAFDVGFQLAEQNTLEHKLGVSAIETEGLHEALTNQLDAAFAQASGTTASLQSHLQSQLADHLLGVKESTNKIGFQLEAGLAGQVAKSIEALDMYGKSYPAVAEIVTAIKPQTSPLPGKTQPVPVLPQSPLIEVPVDCKFWGALSLDDLKAKFPQLVLTGKQGFKHTWPPGTPQLISHINATFIPNADGTSGQVRLDFMDGYGTVQHITCGLKGYDNTIGDGTGQGDGTNTTVVNGVCCPAVKVDVKFPDCIKFCPEDIKEKKYVAWCNTETGVLYVQVEGVPPKNPGDKQLAVGDLKELDLQKLQQECKKKTHDQQEQQQTETQQVNFTQGVGCDNLFVFPMQVGLDSSNFIKTGLGLDFDAIFKSIDTGSGIIDGVLKGLVSFLRDTVGSGINHLIQANLNAFQNTGCFGPSYLSLFIAKQLLGIYTNFVQGGNPQYLQPIEYSLNSGCPYLLPNANEAVGAYLTDSINAERLDCLLRANGVRPEVYADVIDSVRNRWSPAEAVSLYRREFINKETLFKLLRQRGYLNDYEKEGLVKLTEAIPGVSDLITMMIRDVEDTVNVDWSESDTIFADKWKGQLKKWGENQGVPEMFAKYAWRAHWSLPSPTQAFVFWHRLRKSGKFGTEDQFYETIRNLLLQQDILPKWIDAYLETSFNPLTRVDAKRAYQLGSITEEQLGSSFTDQGYSDANRDILVRYTRDQARQAARRSPAIKAYAKGEITELEFRGELDANSVRPEFKDELVEWGKAYAKRNTRNVCLKSVRKRFMLGELDKQQVVSSLANLPIDPDQVVNLSEAWECEKAHKGKTVPAATLAGWFERGIIDEIDLFRRLKNLDYTEDDAVKLIADVKYRIGVKTDRERAKALKQEIADQRRAESEKRRLQKQIQNNDNAIQREDSRLRKIYEQRQKMLIEIGETWNRRMMGHLPDSVLFVKGVINKALATGLWPINSVYTAALHAAKDPTITTQTDYSNQVVELLSDLAM